MTDVVVEGDAPPWTLTDRLRKAREHRCLEQTQLAALMGVSRRTVVNYEAGRTTPRRPQLIAWALATGVSLAWLEGPDAVRPKGLEPLTFWSVPWRADDDHQDDECAECGAIPATAPGGLCWECFTRDDYPPLDVRADDLEDPLAPMDDVRADDLALAA